VLVCAPVLKEFIPTRKSMDLDYNEAFQAPQGRLEARDLCVVASDDLLAHYLCVPLESPYCTTFRRSCFVIHEAGD